MDPATLESLLIREIRKASEISRRDLADKLGVARSTAGRRVDSLIKRGLVLETGIEDRSGAGKGGRPKRLLELQGEFGKFLGIDFDARFLYAVLVDFAQKTIEEHRFPLPAQPHRSHVLTLIQNLLSECDSQRGDRPLQGVGVGIPGMVEQENRIAVDYPYISEWKQVELLKELKIDPDMLHIENNTRTIALGEYWLGEPEAIENLVCLTVRTGISAAVISHGKLLRGVHEMAGEIRGWRTQGPSSRRKSRIPWLEEAATVRALTKGKTANSEAWLNFVTACRKGEEEALKKLDQFSALHADAAARIVQLADPEKVIFSGAFNQIGGPYLSRLKESLRDALEETYFSSPPVAFATHGEFAGAHGAAALAAAKFRPV